MRPYSLASAVEDVLQQGCTLLESVSDPEFTRHEDGGSSLGAHYRHVLDHFLCLQEGLKTGQVDYDHRRRNPEVESSRETALAVTRNLIADFRNFPAGVLQRTCTVVYSIGYGEDEAHAVGSNVAREIMFCVGHAIHHYAILKMLCVAMSVRLPYEFGVAPSTLKHQAAQAGH